MNFRTSSWDFMTSTFKNISECHRLQNWRKGIDYWNTPAITTSSKFSVNFYSSIKPFDTAWPLFLESAAAKSSKKSKGKFLGPSRFNNVINLQQFWKWTSSQIFSWEISKTFSARQNHQVVSTLNSEIWLNSEILENVL